MRGALAVLGLIVVVAALGATPTDVRAHINSPHIYQEASAGPYPAVFVAHMPPAIPGEAEIQLRLLDLRSDEEVRVRVRGIPPEGESHAPEWIDASRSSVDASFFTAPLPLMTFGVWRAEIEVTGDRGSGSIGAPVPAKRPNPGNMEPGLAAFLVVLIAFLLAVAWMVLVRLRREAVLPAGHDPDDGDRRAGRRVATTGLSIIVLWIAFIGFSWHVADSAHRAAGIPPIQADLEAVGGNPNAGRPSVLELRLTDREGGSIEDLVEDHGRLMHLVVVDADDASRFYHLHPEPTEAGRFRMTFTPPEAGRYRFLGGILQASGERQTVSPYLEVGGGRTVTGYLPLPGEEPSSVRATPLEEATVGDVVSDVGDGLVLRWLDPDPVLLRAGEFERLTFELQDGAGAPIADLEPYDGAMGHLFVLRHDGEVYAHVYPSGTLGEAGATTDRAARVTGLPGRGAGPGRIAFPYGFPEEGTYRCFVQVRSGGTVRTGVFDVSVR